MKVRAYIESGEMIAIVKNANKPRKVNFAIVRKIQLFTEGVIAWLKVLD